jgi:hypothetical protein
MRHQDRKIQTLGDLIAGLRDTATKGLAWYRGHARLEWKLVPGIARPGGGLEAEFATIKRFKQSAAPYLPSRPLDEWEWVFLMQHHRAPTRLLDWTESPLVALYFALHDTKHDDVDAAIWCLDPCALNRLSGHTPAFELDILAFGVDKQVDEYLPANVNERVSKLKPIAAIGPRNSARMVAQSGAFTVIHAEATAVEDVGDGNHIWRFIIPSGAKAMVREELRLLGISEHSLFPDLDRVALLSKALVS